jgi:hypothetical protein
MDPIDTRYWARDPGLIWSNPGAGEAVRIRRALLQPRFGRLLDIALRFGLDRLRREWNELEADATPGVCVARPTTERILRNLETGFTHAARRD